MWVVLENKDILARTFLLWVESALYWTWFWCNQNAKMKHKKISKWTTRRHVLWIRFYACNEQIAFQKRRRLFSFSSIVACLTCRRLANCTGCLKFFGIIRKFCRRLLLPKTHHNRFLANDKPDCIVLHHYDRGQLEKHGYSSNDTTNLTGHSIVADNGGKYIIKKSYFNSRHIWLHPLKGAPGYTHGDDGTPMGHDLGFIVTIEGQWARGWGYMMLRRERNWDISGWVASPAILRRRRFFLL